MLTIGLDILRILAEADGPLTATAIAERVGLHLSNVSRTLRVLASHGYVCKPSYHSFAPDLGVLALAGAAAQRLPVVSRTREALKEVAIQAGMSLALAALHRDQVLYLHRIQADGSIASAVSGGWPLHLSEVGLRLLLELPEEKALEVLGTASRRYGWERRTPSTPSDPASCIRQARKCLKQGILRTDHWKCPGDTSAAVAVHLPGQPPLAVALHGACPVPDAGKHFKQHLLAAVEALTQTLGEESGPLLEKRNMILWLPAED